MSKTVKRESKQKPIDTVLDEPEVGTEDGLWLMKVPHDVYERLLEGRDGDRVGNLRLNEEKSSSGKPMYEIILQQGNSEGMTGYTVEELSKGPPVYAFDYDHTQNKFTRVGYVNKKTSMRPQETNNYHENMRKRSLASDCSHPIQKLDNASYGQFLGQGAREVDFVPPAYATNKRKLTERAKNKGDVDPDELRRKVLATLNESERMTLKDIAITCDALEKDCREVLHTYGSYIKSGRFKHFWELKPEFREHCGEAIKAE